MGGAEKDLAEAKETCFQFICDKETYLVQEAEKMVKFLKQVEKVSDSLHQNHVIHNAVRRYETIWLPLLVRNTEGFLEPPLDVHWAWHVHMLCPRKYAADCKGLLSMIPKHKYDSNEVLARELWKKVTDESYDIEYQDIPDGTIFESRLSYDIVAASQRQKEFYYNVSLPHFSSTNFLKDAFKRYQMFINLKRYRQTAFLVPLYDIDLLWHTHQCCPVEYQEDMEKFLGFVLDHDDTTTDRRPGSKLSDATSNTHKLWREAYPDNPYYISGAMYRGPNPRGRLYTMTKEEQNRMFRPKYFGTVTSVVLTGNLKAKYKLCGDINDGSKFNSSKLSLKKGLPFEWHGVFIGFHVVNHNLVTLTLNLSRKDGFWGAIQAKQFQQIEFTVSVVYAQKENVFVYAPLFWFRYVLWESIYFALFFNCIKNARNLDVNLHFSYFSTRSR